MNMCLLSINFNPIDLSIERELNANRSWSSHAHNALKRRTEYWTGFSSNDERKRTSNDVSELGQSEWLTYEFRRYLCGDRERFKVEGESRVLVERAGSGSEAEEESRSSTGLCKYAIWEHLHPKILGRC